MIIKFRSRYSYVCDGHGSYDESDQVRNDSSTVMSREELLRIRRLSPREFETAFENQLQLEKREALLSIYFMREAYRRLRMVDFAL